MTRTELLEKIADKSDEVRAAQKAFFRTHAQLSLQQSKALETELDLLLHNWTCVKRGVLATQPQEKML